MLSACIQHPTEQENTVLHQVQSIDFEHPLMSDSPWQHKGDVEISDGFLRLIGDSMSTTEWYSEVVLDSTWRRVRISGKVKIPSLSPQAQFGKTARLYTAFYSAKGDLLSFTGDINFTHLTWRNPFDEWKYFEHSFNLPKYLDNNIYRNSQGKSIMDLRFQIREAVGEMWLDDIVIDIVPTKYEMQAEEFHREILPQIKAKEKIGTTITQTDIANISNIIHVNNQATNASDANKGHADTPLMTLHAALQRAISSELPTKVIIHEGEYLEENQIIMEQKHEQQPLLVIEGKGNVRITGSKRLTNWEKTATNLYVHDWIYDMGQTEQIWGGKGPWGKLGYIQPAGLRKELLLINGVRCQQVFHQDSLMASSFFVDETTDKLWVHTPLDLQTGQHKVEAGVLGDLLNVSNRSNLVLSNLSFVNGAKFVPFGSVEFSFCENILIENCRFLNNNSTGLLFNYAEHVTVRNCISSYNGWNGMKFEYAQYIRSENNEFSYNGWRANMGDLNGWDLAANKNFNTHHFIVDGGKMYDNRGHGLWFDWCNSDITIKNMDIIGNYGNGIYYEVSQGPATITETHIAQNGNSGISVAEAWNLTIDNCQIYDNHSSQIEERARLRTADDEYSTPAYTFDGHHLQVKNTTVSSIVPNSYLTEAYSMWDNSVSIFENMIKSYRGDNNLYFHSLYDTAMTIERHRWANLSQHDRLARGGRITLDRWSERVDERNAQWQNAKLPRLIIAGLPDFNNTLTPGDSLQILQKHTQVESLKLGLINTEKYTNQFRYALSEYTELELNNGKAIIPRLPAGHYSLVAYGIADGNLIQSYRVNCRVSNASKL